MVPYFAEAADPVWLAERFGYDLDEWQKNVLRSTSHQQLIVLAARQCGKSTVAALSALHEALFTPRALVLLVAPSLRQSQEIFRKAKECLNRPGMMSINIDQESQLRVEFTNGSRIISLVSREQTIRGFSSVKLICCGRGQPSPR